MKGASYGRRADIWSVGCTVVEMFTGKHPWPDIDNGWSAIFTIARSTTGPPLPPGLSDMAVDFLRQTFQYEPKSRPTSAELLKHPFVRL